MEIEHFSYDNKIVKAFMIATVIFGLVGMLVGLTAAIQLVYPILNFDLQYTTFGRIRPLHTNADHFCICGKCDVCRRLLLHATFAEGQNVQ